MLWEKICSNIICSCGNHNPIIKLDAGRSNDWILGKDGRRIHAYLLIQMLQQINFQTEGMILQYQIIQKDFNNFDFHLVLEEKGMKTDIIELIGREVNVKIILYDKLFASAVTGQLACFINELLI